MALGLLSLRASHVALLAFVVVSGTLCKTAASATTTSALFTTTPTPETRNMTCECKEKAKIAHLTCQLDGDSLCLNTQALRRSDRRFVGIVKTGLKIADMLIGGDLNSILGQDANKIEHDQWHPGPTPDVKKCRKKEVDTSDFCSAMQHPLNIKVFNERSQRDKEARDLFDKIAKNFNSSESELGDDKKDQDSEDKDKDEKKDKEDKEDDKDKDEKKDKEDIEDVEETQPIGNLWALNSGVCKKVLQDALCLAAFPPCECDDYKTACNMNCEYMNHCAEDAGVPKLCQSCDNYCEFSCCISVEIDTTYNTTVVTPRNCRSTADAVQAPSLSLIAALVAFAASTEELQSSLYEAQRQDDKLARKEEEG
eukprot:CAMPEP_0173113182 /NCGR_PEP_ID=MMETSP1102-20130122/46654_1 /TAXON_ID=49646 /ORGANISM="Geminigera sp., Strain Caron Lab Isolate" /LENGTH=366 /DNA_ID=CAMNT_0014014781 /DNA_START=30 /DNA_END=1131 /DNA_ORIENTATION=-